MPGYLEGYGEGEERRGKIIRWTALAVLIIAVLAGALYFILRDRSEKKRVEAFFDDLKRKDYTSAYELWGCSQAHPCPQYAFNKFMEDWGAQGQRNLSSFEVVRSRTCGSGVVVTVEFQKGAEESLWVQKTDRTIGFSPFSAGCPAVLLCRRSRARGPAVLVVSLRLG